ncbi:hypothetical protein LCGC14_2935790, partial [marine sediment metagenome]
ARTLRQSDPQRALSLLQETRKRVESSGLEPTSRDQLLRRVDRALFETQQFIEQNLPRIELTERNQQVRGEIEREQNLKLEKQEKLAVMVDKFNKLMDEQRYAEAEVVAKKVEELDPNNPMAGQLNWYAKFVRRDMLNRRLRADKEDGYWLAMHRVDELSTPYDDNNPLQFGPVQDWSQLSERRRRMFRRDRRRTEREIEIEQKLKTPVGSLRYTNAPLHEVLKDLSTLAEVNIHLDPQGLAEEAVTPDTPINFEVRSEIMLKSVLHLILEPLHLDYVIKDEVLKITSEQLTEGEVFPIVYSVGDLVVPIPNFTPSTRMGLAGALHNAMGDAGLGGGAFFGGGGSSPMAVVASTDGTRSNAAINPGVLAQMSASGATPS